MQTGYHSTGTYVVHPHGDVEHQEWQSFVDEDTDVSSGVSQQQYPYMGDSDTIQESHHRRGDSPPMGETPSGASIHPMQ